MIYRAAADILTFQVDSVTALDYRKKTTDYRPAKRRIGVSVGDSVRIIRKLQELSHNQIAALTGIPQATISAIENDRVKLGGRTGEGACQSTHMPSRCTYISWMGMAA